LWLEIYKITKILNKITKGNKMKIKNFLILNKDFDDALNFLLTLKMPAYQSLEISKCIDDVIAKHQTLDRTRKAIVERYCLKDKEGNPTINKEGNVEFKTVDDQKSCLIEVQKILDEETEVTLSEKVRIDKNQSITPLQIKLLRDFVVIDK
jgi:hypothetical protein